MSDYVFKLRSVNFKLTTMNMIIVNKCLMYILIMKLSSEFDE